MGLVRYHNGPLQGKGYCGWVDVETKMPISDMEIKAKYETHMTEHTGIRLIARREHDTAEPDQQLVLHEVLITHDLAPFESSPEAAADLQREHGEHAIVTYSADGQQAWVTLRKGASLWVPKATQTGRAIGAQMPKGWDASRFGIPDDIISQVDPVTLYALVAAVDALLSAGITDPFELYEHMDVSQLGNTVGGGMGGTTGLQALYKQRLLDRPVQNDVLADTFINTTAAWLNMLLLGSAGPLRTPVGACATGLESVDTAYDLLVTGKAKAVLVGGTEGLEREPAVEFANMKATVNADEDELAGRPVKQSSRPTASTRAGFVECEGAGIQLLTTARVALDMALPIHGIISLSHMASDGVGRSVPAPGKGLLTIATEKSGELSPRLDLEYRRNKLQRRIRQVEERRKIELSRLRRQDSSEEARQIDADAKRSVKEALNAYGNEFWKHDDRISPLRGSLAVWGLTVDDIDVASLHGTSTVKNDINETDVIQRQLVHLGRTKGNVLPCVTQKSLLGHGKGSAGKFDPNLR